jgi:lipoyl(octanoyl) transferase
MAAMVTSLLYLGRIDYPTALALQQHLVELRHQQRVGDVLLLLEHPPVLTLGRNARRSNILAGDEVLARRGVDIVETNRGGDVTYHGPGQLVGYPILDLRAATPRMGAIDYVRKLEEVLIRTCAEFQLLTDRVPGRTGVWTRPGGSILEKKIAAIGVHISRGITSHGFAFNVTVDLADFGWIIPCGIDDRSVTSLDQETGVPVGQLQMENIANRVARQFGRVFDTQILHLEKLDDLLHRAAEAQPAAV